MLEDFARREQRVVWMNMNDGVEKTVASVCDIDIISNLQELNNV